MNYYICSVNSSTSSINLWECVLYKILSTQINLPHLLDGTEFLSQSHIEYHQTLSKVMWRKIMFMAKTGKYVQLPLKLLFKYFIFIS